MSSELLEITLRSLAISGSATLLSSLWSIPIAYLLAKSRGYSRIFSPIAEALVGAPTVLVGLALYALLCSRGLLGSLQILYTPYAVILGQSILITPLMISISFRALLHSYESYGELALSLGATERQAMILALKEGLPGLLAAEIMSFSRAIGELGVALMIGGNIKGYTRVLTTAIALEVSKGDFELALSLGGILLILMILVSLSLRALRRFQER